LFELARSIVRGVGRGNASRFADGKPFFGLLPLGATIGIFSDIEGMGNQITSINSIEGGIYYRQNAGIK